MGQKDKGIYEKFEVVRTDGQSGEGGKHEDCTYFVLDLAHDTFAPPALKAYAAACEEEYPLLARDINRTLQAIECRILDEEEQA